MMKKLVLLASVAFAVSATAVSAQTLRFNDLAGCCYGDGYPILPNMTYDSQTLTYSKSGFILTLNTQNPVGNPFGAHIGDGTNVPRTYNWHDGGDNDFGAYVTLALIGGGSFGLTSFDWASNSTDFVVDFGGGPVSLGTGSGTYFANLTGLTSVSFYGNDGNQLDNIVLSGGTPGVPEPASWALMLLGFGAVGVAARRTRATRVRYV